MRLAEDRVIEGGSSGSSVDFSRLLARVPTRAPMVHRGKVVELTGVVIRATVEGVSKGELVEISVPGGGSIPAEVVGFRGDEVLMLPFGETRGLHAGAEVFGTGHPLSIEVGHGLLGRVLDGLGRPLDGRPLPAGLQAWAVNRPAPTALERTNIEAPISLGLRVLDGLLTAGEGQRIGLFAGSGVGKSVLMGQIARGSEAEVVVVGLVGERGWEVRHFVDRILGPEGRDRAVVVAGTSDAPALVRLQSAHVATAVAEWFAEVEGRHVLLVVDSLTRFARAQREVGLAAGEPPVRQGYPPSVFSELPRLVERAGTRRRGAITAVYTVLVAGGDMEEPIADEVRGLLDAHLVLDRKLSERGHYPAVDVLQSVSRVMASVAEPRHLDQALRVRRLLATWELRRDLISLGAYAPGSDPDTDEALARIDRIEQMLRQGVHERTTLREAIAALEGVLA